MRDSLRSLMLFVIIVSGLLTLLFLNKRIGDQQRLIADLKAEKDIAQFIAAFRGEPQDVFAISDIWTRISNDKRTVLGIQAQLQGKCAIIDNKFFYYRNEIFVNGPPIDFKPSYLVAYIHNVDAVQPESPSTFGPLNHGVNIIQLSSKDRELIVQFRDVKTQATISVSARLDSIYPDIESKLSLAGFRPLISKLPGKP